MLGLPIISLMVVGVCHCLPQLDQAEADPWLAVINANTNEADSNKEVDDGDYYQFAGEDTRQAPVPGYGYPGDNRRVAPGPQPGRYQPPPPQQPVQRLPGPLPGNRRQGPPPQRRPLPPPPGRAPPPPPAKKKEGGILDTVVNGVQNVASGLTCTATNLIADEKLNDDKFIRSQMDCAMNRAPCDEIGRQIRILAPEVLAGRCPAPCNPCIKNQIRKVMSQLSQRYPREFQQMMAQLSRKG